MRDLARGPRLPKGIPVTAEQEASDFRLIGKANKAGAGEVSENVRARSAVMRVLERIDPNQKNQGARSYGRGSHRAGSKTGEAE